MPQKNFRLGIVEKKIFILLCDFAFVFFSLFLTIIFREDIGMKLFISRGYFGAILLYTVFAISIFYISDLFNVFVIDFWSTILPRIFFGVSLTVIFIIVSSFYLESLALPRISIIAVGFFLIIGITMLHYYMVIIKREPFKVMIIGSGFAALKIIEDIQKSGRDFFHIVGIYDQDTQKSGMKVLDIEIRGGIDKFLKDVEDDPPEMIVVSFDYNLIDQWTDALFSCVRKGVEVSSAVDVYGKLFSKVPSDHIDALWFLSGLPFMKSYSIFRRCMDILCGLIGLAIMAVLFPLLFIAIKLTSPGPFIFSQTRVGLHGKIFKIHKIRTMIVNAEKDTGPVWCRKKDSRITPVGKIMRKLRIDELPQFWNILKGDMSLIGPRPERPEFVEQLKQRIPFYDERHLVKPGLTGWAQVLFPYGNTVEHAVEKLHYDLFYIRNMSFFMDIKIILKTIATVVCGKGGM